MTNIWILKTKKRVWCDKERHNMIIKLISDLSSWDFEFYVRICKFILQRKLLSTIYIFNLYYKKYYDLKLIFNL